MPTESAIRATGKQRPVAPVRSVAKALDFLDILGFEDIQDRGLTLTELADRMDMPVNSAHNLIKTMAMSSYVAKSDDGKYIVGPSLLRMGRVREMVSDPVMLRLKPILEDLNERLGELISLAMLANGKRVLLALLESNQTVRIDHAVLDDEKMYLVPTGRVLVAFADPYELAAIKREHGQPGSDWDDIVDDTSFEQARAAIRHSGEAIMIDESEGTMSFACPILDEKNRVRAAIGCGAPLYRCDLKRARQLLATLKVACPALRDALLSSGKNSSLVETKESPC